MKRSLLGVGIGVIFAVAAPYGCGSADEHPLGGPYGGSSSATKPGGGSTSGSTNGASGGGTTGTSSGDQGASGTTSGSTSSSGGGTSGGGGSSTSSSSSSSSSSSGSSGTSGGSSGTSGGSSSGTSGGTAAPTWTQLHTLYLKSGTVGNCPHCHSSTGSASSAFTWIKNKGYSPAALVDKNQSCLSWFGGNMPSSGVTSAAAAKDFNAWFAAGGLNN